jgi:DNA-binding beta-propeller fold protein YncE
MRRLAPRRRSIGWLAASAAAAAAAGCGSSTELPPAAEPGRAPPLAVPPAGRSVWVGHKAEGVAVDPATGLVAVGITNPDLLALVDGRAGRLRRRLPLPESPRHLQLAGAGGPVLVPAERSNELVEVDLPGGRMRTTKVGAFPHDATRAGEETWVADELGHTLSVVARGRVVERLRAPLQPGGIAAAESGRRVAVVAVRERVVGLYDTNARRELARAPAGVGPTHLVSNGIGRLWVIDTQGNALLYFHLAPRLELVRRVHLPGRPYGVAVDLERDRLWVTLTARNEVVEVSANGRPRPLRRFPTVRQPNSVGVDPRTGRVFVASRTDGTLQLLDPSRERPLDGRLPVR